MCWLLCHTLLLSSAACSSWPRCLCSLGTPAHGHTPAHTGNGHGPAVPGGTCMASTDCPGCPRLLWPVTVPLSSAWHCCPAGMMSFPRWLWHRPLGQGCWPGDREKTVWAHRDGQMGSQGGRKDPASKSLLYFLSPVLLQISIPWDPPLLELHRDDNQHLKSSLSSRRSQGL